MTLIIGHRGCRGLKNPPENSLAAFHEAIRQGADGIEFDLFLSADKTLVVFHDDTLEKLTSGEGKTSRTKLSDLKKLRLRENGGKALSKETIPTLDEVLALVKKEAPKGFLLNVEIKQKGIAGVVASALKHYLKNGWKNEQFLISSFDIASLRAIRKALPEIPIGVLVAGEPPSWRVNEKTLVAKLRTAKALSATTVNIAVPGMTAGVLKHIASANARPVAWTSREKPPLTLPAAAREKLRKLATTPGLMMITDYPGEMRELLKKAPH